MSQLTPARILALVALVLAILSYFIAGPLLIVAVVLLAIALLL